MSGSDVYVAGISVGYNKFCAKLWKNNEQTNLTDGLKLGKAFSVVVANNDVYVAGYDGKIAKLWKNGVSTDLTDGTESAGATSVCVNGTDVYVAGYEKSKAKLWKNGTPIDLESEGSVRTTAYSIYVK